MAKYSKKAGQKVEKVMHEQKSGKLKSGGNGKKVTSRKQAIAIGLSEAREAGAKVPRKAATKKTAQKKAASKKGSTKKPGPKKGISKTATSKSASKPGRKKRE